MHLKNDKCSFNQALIELKLIDQVYSVLKGKKIKFKKSMKQVKWVIKCHVLISQGSNSTIRNYSRDQNLQRSNRFIELDRDSAYQAGKIPGEGKGYPLQYSGLKNSMDYIVHGVAKNQTQLSDLHFLFELTKALLKTNNN